MFVKLPETIENNSLSLYIAKPLNYVVADLKWFKICQLPHFLLLDKFVLLRTLLLAISSTIPTQLRTYQLRNTVMH